MTVAITTQPQYPVAGRQIVVGFSSSAGNYVKGYFTDAPAGSDQRKQLITQNAARVAAFTVDSGKTWLFTPDVPGVYTFQIEEYTKGATTWGGGYDGAAAGFASEALVSTTNGVTIAVGQKITQRTGTGPDTATLTLFIHNGIIRRSLVEAHGFASPLIDDPKTPRALTASLNTTLSTAVAALIDVSVAAALGTLATVVDDMITKYTAHIASGVFHAAADADNTVSTAYKAPGSPIGLRDSMTKILRALSLHMRNDDGGGGGAGSKGYHVVTAVNHADWLNALIVTSAGDPLSTFVAVADWWRAYEGHRVNASVHPAVDNTNTLAALPAILNIHQLFLVQLQATGPTSPPSIDGGVTALVHGAGFETP